MKYTKTLLLLPVIIALVAFTIAKRAISGRVVDEKNNPVQAALITVKRTNVSVATDANGNFNIEAETADILIISSVGFEPKEVRVGTKSVMSIVLKAASDEMDEVVVIGYGQLNKKELSGSIAGVSVSRAYTPVPAKGIYQRNESWRYNQHFNTEGYDNIKENQFLKATDNPLSTFSIDVDGASYSNIRRFINDGHLPPDGAVRIEEMINYFTYKYPQPTGDAPFSINTEYAVCPWNSQHTLVSIGLQGRKISTENLPAANLVFLIDVSGSMDSPDKLPLVQSSMKMLSDQLRPQDRVAIVVYAGNAGLVLSSTAGNRKLEIKDAINRLQAGGSTAGGAGIQLAYKVAEDHFIKGGNNRIVLCTDGDFNVGESSDDALERLIGKKRETGVFLTVLGFGTGNYQDAKMQKLADKGNGNHAYIDNFSEAKKVLIRQFGGTMFTIAKDVKLQVEFNPAKVQGYRLIGYENRILAKEDFNDDKKDAGEMGSGHTVTALYEIIPAGVNAPELKKVDDLKYQKPAQKTNEFAGSNEIMNVKFRYKKPDGDKSMLLQQSISNIPIAFNKASENFHLSAAVAQFGMLLRNSEFKGTGGYSLVKSLLSGIDGIEDDEYRGELLQLVSSAYHLSSNKDDWDAEADVKIKKYDNQYTIVIK